MSICPNYQSLGIRDGLGLMHYLTSFWYFRKSILYIYISYINMTLIIEKNAYLCTDKAFTKQVNLSPK
jgi:hypothetical protein